ncbi:tetratricopeptide repeat protein [Desulfosporosinus sp. Sb-LF]|uniref:tetratricopeptide repeat protein n=1 Tax=Desulfosporosinus sp. Sb-LF TaxID=2560027 RepID=UPI00107F4029|nr:tetratricopeptide repeat protein [Desulfosporosinus sp. Sb-LF]TGE33017.1 tetratricopeptide repeat protein [Desulfosporosinus sp. Sb-LF]
MNLYSWYGLYAIISEYVSGPSKLPLLCRYEHGWNPLPEPNPYDLRTDQPLMLVWSKRRLQEWNEVSSIPAAIMGAPFVHYRKLRQIEKDIAANGTVAFPAHSTPLIDAVFDIDEYCEQLKSLPTEYHPITICLHVHDLERQKDAVYKKHGFNVVSAGEGTVLGFEHVQKFYDILRSHKYATSNQVGSYSFYAVEMGIPFFIFGEPAHLENSGEPLMPRKYSYQDYPIGIYATELFRGLTQAISEEQKKFVEDELGVHDCLSGVELRELIIESNQRTIEAYQEFLKTGQGGVEEKISICEKLYDYYLALGEKDKKLKYIFKSFEYAPPRADFCCHLGLYFSDIEQYEQAIFWYKLAVQLEKPSDSRLMWLPHVQLCVCYDRLGNHELAYEHNEIARNYSPKNEAVLYNKNYLERVLGIESPE